MPLTEYEAVSRTLVESSRRADAATTRRPAPNSHALLELEVERLRGMAEEAEERLAASERRAAELDALCKARHAGLQVVLAQLQDAEQRALAAERALTREISDLAFQLEAAELASEALTRSLSWRCTAPFRWIAGWAPARRPGRRR